MTEISNQLIVTIEGEDWITPYADLGLSFDSTETEIMNAIAPVIREKFNVSLQGEYGWLFKTRKATTARNIYVIPNSTAGNEAVSYLSDNERLDAYNLITAGCQHLWSKNKLQEEKLKPVLETFSKLAEKDPLFLACLTSYLFKKSDSKDLKVLACYASTLSDADGTPFSPGSKYSKPNWRLVGQAAFQELDPKLALRVLKLANTKHVFGKKSEATHYSKHLKTAAQKYLKCREANPQGMVGVRKSGLKNTVMSMYRIARTAPSPEAVKVLGWKQKPGFPGSNVALDKKVFDFTGLDDLGIAKKIQTDKIPALVALGALGERKLSPVIAAAVLEQCSGDQAVILTDMFEKQGLFKEKEIKDLYTEKVKGAKNALDRVERMGSIAQSEAEQILKQAKSDSRKATMGNIGKIYVSIDVSPSMESAIETAKHKCSIIAECVSEPEKNFHWGSFHGVAKVLPKPKGYEKDAFLQALFGVRADGTGTNCLANYEEARKLGCDVDVYITDQEHNYGAVSLATLLTKLNGARPKAAIVVDVHGRKDGWMVQQFRTNGIPVTVLNPSQLTESALVAQSVRDACLGPVAIIEEIMSTQLMKLPKWWESVKA